MQCNQCANANSDDHRFCFNCGAALTVNRQASTAPGRGGSSGEGERRHLTVMFCDVVDSTALSMEYDPEDLTGATTLPCGQPKRDYTNGLRCLGMILRKRPDCLR